MTLPTNINNAPLGTIAVGGVNNYTKLGTFVGAPYPVLLSQGTDLGDAVTAGLMAQWTAPFAGFFRDVEYSTYSTATVCTFDVYNSTQAALVIAAQTPTSNAAAHVSTFTTSAFAQGDVIQLRITTSGGSGACKGLQVWLHAIPTVDSTINTYV